ncbi:LPS assembly protein LptD [Leisingera aquaemixtae]|uniref:LPS-assembly protein LptD n=1 Tax=Leisingera aquaemixtae TaxID=1396826 RepID=UPI001C982958|nr:LPS assembly protein LptD [Leisingera aquaemixtae]MBY6065370.1 LPS assembly protein LptD [Leisingera aquaemixtae]
MLKTGNLRRALLLSAVLPWLALSAPAPQAQTAGPADPAQPAMLVADQVFITPDRTLVAEGNVEAFQGNIRLRAQKITFDQETGTLQIEGPIRIDQDGDMTILANAAEMDSGLRNGLLTGARMVFEQQLQLASAQMTRVSGRYTQLYKTAVTSCHVCEDGRPPLWQIRAERVTHDQQERQLYFENAQLRVLDVPVFYFPAFRLPDPSLERTSGFLIPSLRSTSNLGTGIKVPYFFTLGPHKDLTLAPYVSSSTRTLDLRYRQAFRNGRIELEGAYTRDDLYPNEDRGYFFGKGRFNLPRDYRFTFDIKTVSDDAYLSDYGLPDLDRLRSRAELARIRRDSLFLTSLSHYKTLRDSEIQSEIPSGIAEAFYQKRYFPSLTGGELRLTLQGHGHHRSSSLEGNETASNGRDVARLTADLGWRRSWQLGYGALAEAELGAAGDAVRAYDDTFFTEDVTRLTPRGALTFRLPMTRRETSGATQYLEPILQLGWRDEGGGNVVSEESRFIEFDQGNLLSLSRFPSNDAREDGFTLVYGANWARYAPDGWQAYATVGQVLRSDGDPRFTKSSGLGGTTSDILMAGQIKFGERLAISSRGLLNGSLNFSKAELRGEWRTDRAGLSGTYLWLGTDPAEEREKETSELYVTGRYSLNPNWSARARLRYDISDARATRAGLGLAYSNECVTVDLSVSRRYTSTTSVEPTTDFGFTISLSGFSVKSGNKQYRRSCSKT